MSNTPIKSDDFWFEDGDIVLSVTEGDVEHHFFIHRRILTEASPVFSKMLSMPRPVGSEGLPVPLPDDSVHDLTVLLGALYWGRLAQVTFDVELGVLRLSHKYKIERLQQWAMERLLEDWPLNHSKYLASLKFYLDSPRYRILEATRLIETAQKYHVHKLLPAAYYELACALRTQWPEIVRKLSDDNAARLWHGHARSEQRLRSFVEWTSVLPLVYDPYPEDEEEPLSIFRYRNRFPECAARPGTFYESYDGFRVRFCRQVFVTLRTKLGERMFDGEYAISALQKFGREDLDDDSCANCKDWFEHVLENKVQELWYNIPADFDLPKISMWHH